MLTDRVGGGPVASVVVPAHNEGAVIVDSLRMLLGDVPPGTFEVVVVCNGCTDDTADRVRAAFTGTPAFTVLETPVASKVHALRLGDRAARTFPRAYLDADVRLPGRSLVEVARLIDMGPAVAGRPAFRYDTTGASWPVRRYYAARARMRGATASLWGAGVYVLSEGARARFGEWPDVIADDLFVDTLVAAGERVVVDVEPASVRVPRTTQALLHTLRRVQRGKNEQRSAPATTGRSVRDLARSAVRSPDATLDAVVYGTLAVASRLPRRRRTPAGAWERDDSSRVPA